MDKTIAVASCNPCVQIFTTTTKRVVEGVFAAPDNNARCSVAPRETRNHGAGVSLFIQHQIYSKAGVQHLIDSLTEIHEAL